MQPRAHTLMMVFCATLVAFAAGCARREPARPARLDYTPQWMSPDGRYLIVRPVGVLDLTAGEEVLPEIGRTGESGMTSAAWAPASDLLCWLRLDGRVSMWRPPAGRPMDLTPNLLEYLQYQTGNTAICFGRSEQELVLGAPGYGPSRHLPEHASFSVFGVGQGRLQPGDTVTAPLSVPPGSTMEMLPIADGSRVLVVYRTEHKSPERGIYLLDLAGRSLTVAAGERAQPIAALRARWGERMDYLPFTHLVGPDRQGQYHFVLYVRRADGRDIGCELLSLRPDAKPGLTWIGLARDCIGPPAVLPSDGGFVFARRTPALTVQTGTKRWPAGNLVLLDATLQHQRSLTEGAVLDELPLWSHALGRVVFRRDQRELWSVCPQGGDARRVWPRAGEESG